MSAWPFLGIPATVPAIHDGSVDDCMDAEQRRERLPETQERLSGRPDPVLSL
jgi:hypothetical protein